MNQQREVIYSLRLFALERGEELKAEARRMIESAVETMVQRTIGGTADPGEWDRTGLQAQLMLQYLINVEPLADAARTPDLPGVLAAVRAEAEAAFQRKVDYLVQFGRSVGITDVDMQVLSQVMLSVLDEKWKDHLYDLDQLRNAIHYRSYGQKDPLVEYKREAYEMFEDLMRDIHGTFTERYLKIQVTAGPPRSAAPPPTPPTTRAAGPSSDDLFTGPAPRSPAIPAPPVTSSLGPVGAPRPAGMPEVGRNDPCPCGSGKKYKKCHGARG
jgi:preprotein translocase subunit SecA